MAEELAYLEYLGVVQMKDRDTIVRKEQHYKGSWKKRGGLGAFFVMARKWDAIENMLAKADHPYDIFYSAALDWEGDGSLGDQIRDLRCYLTMIEAHLRYMGHVEYALDMRDADAPNYERDNAEYCRTSRPITSNYARERVDATERTTRLAGELDHGSGPGDKGR